MAVQSFTYDNRPRDLSDVLSTIIAVSPRFIILFREVGRASQTKVEWLQDQVKGRTFTFDSATGGVVTVSLEEGKRVRKGMDVSLKDDSAVFTVIDATSTTVTLAFKSQNGSKTTGIDSIPTGGGIFRINSEPTREASKDGATSFRQSSTEWNQTQIFRDGIEVSETSLEIKTFGNENTVAYQEANALRNLSLDMNSASLYGVREQRNENRNGSFGGLYYFGTQPGCLKVELPEAKPLSSVDINDAAQNIKNEGGDPQIILVGTGQARVLSSIYQNKLQVVRGDETRGAYVSKIVNDIDGALMTIFVEPSLADTDAWVIDPSGFGRITLRPMKSTDASEKGMDGIARKIIGEFTLQFKNAKQRLCRISNLLPSAQALLLNSK